MDIEVREYEYAEYILPCAVNLLSEDDIIIEFVINVSMVYLFIDLCKCLKLF